MTENSKAIRKHAKRFFGEHPLGPGEQTRIALFIQGLKGVNAAVLARVEVQPFEWLPYKFLHSQYFKEVELSTLLAKGTQWSTDPFVYLDATNLNLLIWQRTGAAKYLQGFLQADRSFYEYLSLSHAFMADVRFLPLLPTALALDTPFLSALKEVEEESGRQIQTQIRLLKDLDVDLSAEQKEAIIERQRAVVTELFDRLLAEVSGFEAAKGAS